MFNASLAISQNQQQVEKTTIGTQTDSVQTESKYTWVDGELEVQPFSTPSQNLINKRKFEDQPETSCFNGQPDAATNMDHLPAIFSFNNSNSSTPKKQRLLIGKNTNKIPELSISTLERHLEYLTSNNTNNTNNGCINPVEQSEAPLQSNAMATETAECKLGTNISSIVFSTDTNMYQQIPYSNSDYIEFETLNLDNDNVKEEVNS